MCDVPNVVDAIASEEFSFVSARVINICGDQIICGGQIPGL